MEELKNHFKYWFGDLVYLKTDVDQSEGIITGITMRPKDVLYLITFGKEETGHYDFEFSSEKNILKSLS